MTASALISSATALNILRASGLQKKSAARTTPGSSSMHAKGRCHPRIGILGNPSDGYGGRVLAACFDDFAAEAIAEAATQWSFEGTRVADLEGELKAPEVLDRGDPGLEGLLLAAACMWRRHALPGAFALKVTSTIPKQVGLSGSSAILIAALRAMAAQQDTPALKTIEVARLALAAERDVLGIAAGPQDRWIQSIGHAAHLDFASDDWRHELVEAERLPRLGLVWASEGGEASGLAHGELRRRFAAGDASLRQAMRSFAELADQGRDALRAEDLDATARMQRFAELIGRAWQLRLEHYPTSASDRALAERVARHACAATLAGSGGALVIAATDGHDASIDAALADARDAGFGALRPRWCTANTTRT